MSDIYPGIKNDKNMGMHATGNIIRDAWVFGLLPESEDCEGWRIGQIQNLYDQVARAWEPYGHLPSRLPDDLRERHKRIYTEATREARAGGWDPDQALADEE
ncbi:MAG: hypothetical protein ACPGU7_04905 [Gammaproteobacteria bacterium]